MKELFKIEPIRKKMPKNLQPKKHSMQAFFEGKTSALTERQIKSIIDVVERGKKDAIAFLNKQIEKLNEQPKQ